MHVYVDTIRTKDDADRVLEIFLQRPGAHPENWELTPLGETYVARNKAGRVVAFARVRFGQPTVVDHLEGERANDHATVAATAGMWALGQFIEEYVGRGGGGRIVAMVHADNKDHQAALQKVGYSERMRAFAKDVRATRNKAG